jgi:feruloyl-CoA synthase
MNPAVRERFTSVLAAFAALQTGSSTRVERAMLLETPPSIDAQEITDKGSINQKAVLRHRAPLVDVLYGAPGPDRVAFLIDVSAGSPQS